LLIKANCATVGKLLDWLESLVRKVDLASSYDKYTVERLIEIAIIEKYGNHKLLNEKLITFKNVFGYD